VEHPQQEQKTPCKNATSRSSPVSGGTAAAGSFFKPLLDVAADGKEHSMKEAREIIAKRMNIAEEDLRELLPSGIQTKFDNRIAWAKSYFVQANVFESPTCKMLIREIKSGELRKFKG
jgi:hypothetical protein